MLLGHNGSGKTTLLRMVAGLLEASTGSIAVFGQHVGSMAARAATSYLGDQPIFYDDLSLREHLEYLARLHGREDWEQTGRRPLRSARPDRPGRRAADDVQPRAAAEGSDRAGVHPAVRVAPRRRAVRRTRLGRTQRAAGVAPSRAPARRRDRRRDPRTDDRGGIPTPGRAARRSGRVRRSAGHRRRRCPGHEMNGRVVIVAPMYEFDSVSVSTFEAATLTAKLTEKSSEGWDVVAVVPTGNDITAFLRRSTAESSTSTGSLDDATWGRPRLRQPRRPSPPAGRTPRIRRPQRVERLGGPEQQLVERRRRRLLPPARPGAPPHATDRARAGGDHARRAGRVVLRPGPPLRPSLLGRIGVDRARVPRRPAVHRPARRLSAAAGLDRRATVASYGR